MIREVSFFLLQLEPIWNCIDVSRKKKKIFSTKRAHLFSLKMRIVLSCCILLSLVLSVWCHTSNIVIGDTSYPIIYNRTVDFVAAKRPWYKSVVSFFSHSEKPVQNVNYTFEPVSKHHRFFIYVVSNVKCNNFNICSFSFYLTLSFYCLVERFAMLDYRCPSDGHRSIWQRWLSKNH